MIRYRSSFGFNIQANAWPVWRSAQDVRALPPLHDLAVELDPNSRVSRRNHTIENSINSFNIMNGKLLNNTIYT